MYNPLNSENWLTFPNVVAMGNHRQTCFGSQLCYLTLWGRCGRKWGIGIDEVLRGCNGWEAVITEGAEALILNLMVWMSWWRQEKHPEKIEVDVPAQGGAQVWVWDQMPSIQGGQRKRRPRTVKKDLVCGLGVHCCGQKDQGNHWRHKKQKCRSTWPWCDSQQPTGPHSWEKYPDPEASESSWASHQNVPCSSPPPPCYPRCSLPLKVLCPKGCAEVPQWGQGSLQVSYVHSSHSKSRIVPEARRDQESHLPLTGNHSWRTASQAPREHPPTTATSTISPELASHIGRQGQKHHQCPCVRQQVSPPQIHQACSSHCRRVISPPSTVWCCQICAGCYHYSVIWCFSSFQWVLSSYQGPKVFGDSSKVVYANSSTTLG